MTLAASAIIVRSNDIAKTIITIAEQIVETNGVRYFLCNRLNSGGRSWFIPIAKDTRLAANVVAFSAASVDTNPPANTIRAPNGR